MKKYEKPAMESIEFEATEEYLGVNPANSNYPIVDNEEEITNEGNMSY